MLQQFFFGGLRLTNADVYPAGIAVGKITKVKYDSDEQLLKVDIKPAVEFESLQKVSVIL